jgi:acyl-CoA synthetase (NDP forming)
VAARMAAAAAAADRPLVVQSMHAASPPGETLRRGGVPVFRRIEAAALALAGLAREHGQPPQPPPPVPPARPPEPVDGYFGARALLEAAGVAFAPARHAAGPEEAARAAEAVGYPLVLKAVGPLHKSDGGGVRVGIGGPAELAAAVAEMAVQLGPAGFSVEAMAPLADGVELIVGARSDPAFGPVIVVGAGGVYAEVFRDVAVALGPVDEPAARDLLETLRCAPLLRGRRGRTALDLDAAAAAVAALSRAAAARPDLAEVEVNPLLVLPRGALALDARVVPAG